MNVSREPYSPPPIVVNLTDQEAALLLEAVEIASGYIGAPRGLRDFALRFNELLEPHVNQACLRR